MSAFGSLDAYNLRYGLQFNMSADFHPDEELCMKYARFASHMEKWEFTIIYWTMFMSNLVILFLASWTFIKYVCGSRPRAAADTTPELRRRSSAKANIRKSGGKR